MIYGFRVLGFRVLGFGFWVLGLVVSGFGFKESEPSAMSSLVLIRWTILATNFLQIEQEGDTKVGSLSGGVGFRV